MYLEPDKSTQEVNNAKLPPMTDIYDPTPFRCKLLNQSLTIFIQAYPLIFLSVPSEASPLSFPFPSKGTYICLGDLGDLGDPADAVDAGELGTLVAILCLFRPPILA